MKTKWLRLAADLLKAGAREFGNHGCNDYRLPDSWTEEERQELLRAMYTANGTPEDYSPSNVTNDWWVMVFLAGELAKMAEIQDAYDNYVRRLAETGGHLPKKGEKEE